MKNAGVEKLEEAPGRDDSGGLEDECAWHDPDCDPLPSSSFCEQNQYCQAPPASLLLGGCYSSGVFGTEAHLSRIARPHFCR
jgi:hypothetical protein